MLFPAETIKIAQPDIEGIPEVIVENGTEKAHVAKLIGIVRSEGFLWKGLLWRGIRVTED